MGFDVYGLSPKMNKDIKKFPIYHKYKDMDWKDKQEVFDRNEKLHDKYWEEHDEFEKSNPGTYFRNNVWWWRPLWEFICDNCDHILNEEQMKNGHNNGGIIIEHDQAEEIHNVIVNVIGKKQIIKMDAEYTEMRKEAEEKNKGKKSTDEDYIWSANYPFDADNVMNFAEFCKQSGGFEIW